MVLRVGVLIVFCFSLKARYKPTLTPHRIVLGVRDRDNNYPVQCSYTHTAKNNKSLVWYLWVKAHGQRWNYCCESEFGKVAAPLSTVPPHTVPFLSSLFFLFSLFLFCFFKPRKYESYRVKRSSNFSRYYRKQIDGSPVWWRTLNICTKIVREHKKFNVSEKLFLHWWNSEI